MVGYRSCRFHGHCSVITIAFDHVEEEEVILVFCGHVPKS